MTAFILYILGVLFGYQAQIDQNLKEEFDTPAFAISLVWPLFAAVLAFVLLYDQIMKLFNR